MSNNIYLVNGLLLAGGGLLYLFKTMINNHSTEKQEKVNSMKKKPVLQVSHIVQSTSKSIPDQSQQAFIEGVITGNQFINSLDNLKQVVYSSRTTYEKQMVLSPENKQSNNEIFLSKEVKCVDQFELQDAFDNSWRPSKLLVYNIKQTNVAGEVLTYKSQHDQTYDSPRRKQIKNPPANDAERAAQQNAPSITQIFSIGLRTREEALEKGQKIVIFGSALYNPVTSNLMVEAPEFIANSKDTIIGMLESDIFLGKVFSTIFFAGAIICGVVFVKNVYDYIKEKQRKDNDSS